MKILLAFFLFSSQALYAGANIIALKGDIKLNGHQISKDHKISQKGLIETGKASFIKFEFKKWGNTVVIGPNSKMKIDPSAKLSTDKLSNRYLFVNGVCRWITSKKVGTKKIGVKTKVASFGVRGTDFILNRNENLGEVEIVLFDGQVEMKGEKSAESKVINPGQWGGLGGRFGDQIKVMTLPKSEVDRFNKLIN